MNNTKLDSCLPFLSSGQLVTSCHHHPQNDHLYQWCVWDWDHLALREYWIFLIQLNRLSRPHWVIIARGYWGAVWIAWTLSLTSFCLLWRDCHCCTLRHLCTTVYNTLLKYYHVVRILVWVWPLDLSVSAVTRNRMPPSLSFSRSHAILLLSGEIQSSQSH